MSQEQADRISNQANEKLLKTIVELSKVTDLLKSSGTEHEDNTYKIAEGLRQLAEIDVQIAEKKRAATVDLDLALKEDAINKATSILTKQGFVAVKQDAFEQLEADHLELKDKFDEKVADVTAKAKEAANASTAIQIRQKEMELQVKEANNAAAIVSLQKENQILTTQAATYLAQLTEERKARIEEAKARGNPSVVVNSGK